MTTPRVTRTAAGVIGPILIRFARTMKSHTERQWVTCSHEFEIKAALEDVQSALASEGFAVLWCEEHNLPGAGPPIGECAHWALKAARPEDAPCLLTEHLLVSMGALL